MIGRDPFVGFIVFIIAVIISRIVMEKALKSLSLEEKARLLDAFSGYRIYNSVSILILIVLYFGAMRYFPESTSTTTPVFLVLFLLVTGIVSLLTYRKLKGLGMPVRYINNYLVCMGIQYLGIGFLVAPFVVGYSR